MSLFTDKKGRTDIISCVCSSDPVVNSSFFVGKKVKKSELERVNVQIDSLTKNLAGDRRDNNRHTKVLSSFQGEAQEAICASNW